MRITQLSLTNFKSFKQTQIIKFAPVTLLFGPNSVGKSTVLMAMAYLQQILQKGQCNPQRLDVLGGKFIGGFRSLVHGRDLTKSINISVEFEKGNYVGQTFSDVLDLLSYELDFYHNSPSEFRTAKIELEISWSKTLNTAYVSSYQVWLNGKYVAHLSSDSGLKQPIIENINFLHPLLLQHNLETFLEDQFDSGFEMHEAFEEDALAIKGYEIPTDREISKGTDWPPEESEHWPVFSSTSFVSQLHELITDSRLTSEHTEDRPLVESEGQSYFHVPLSFKGATGAIPVLNCVIETSLTLDEAPMNTMVHEVLSDAIVAPLDDLLALLESSLSIGPLRSIPDATFQPNPYPQQSDWHNGIAAWDVLAQADVELLRKVDSWISSKAHLDLGYGIALKVEKQFAEFKKISESTDHTLAENQLNNMIKNGAEENSQSIRFDEHNTHYEYALWDADNHIDVRPSDVGVGVSQLMPLVVAALSRDKGLVAVEQPELHVHPRIQVAIGDLLTQLDNSASFLIETHSEHLILRLLRRVRETFYNENPLEKKITADDISVVYLNPSDDGVKVIHYDVTEEGDFTKDWPQGFFSERYKEQ